MAAVDLDNTHWDLALYRDGTVLRERPADAEVTLAFQDGRAGGKSACNRYSTPVTIGDDTLTFGQTVSTRMACPPPLMEIEERFQRALESVAAWRLADGRLELQDSAGQALLVFTRA